MKVLLCSPNTDRPVYNHLGVLPPLVGICPPLGIGYLASALEQDGHDVVLYDYVGCDDGEIRQAISDEAPDVVGVTCFTLSRGSAFDVARIAKAVNSSIHVVIGGAHATALPQQILDNYPEVDAIVMREGEEVIRKWLCLLSDGLCSQGLPGVACRSNGVVLIKRPTSFIADVDVLSFPKRLLANTPPYKPFPAKYRLGRQWSMTASRGCPYRCQFCSTSAFWGNRYRMRSVSNVVDEIEYLVVDCNAEDIEMLDDAFTVNKEWTTGVCSEIIRRGLKFDWSVTTRVNLVDKDLCLTMRRSGCKRVLLGIESFSDDILKNVHKCITQEQAEVAIKTVQSAGLRACCMLMVGNPGESTSTVSATVSSIKKTKPNDLIVNMVQVYPDTELYEIAKASGMLDDSYWLQEDRAAPIFDAEVSVGKLQEYVDMIYDAHWSNRWYTDLYRRSGLRRIKDTLVRKGGQINAD